jgi:hypothetical protein
MTTQIISRDVLLEKYAKAGETTAEEMSGGIRISKALFLKEGRYDSRR